MELKIGVGTVVAVVGLVAGGVATSWATFETKSNATERYEVAATDREKGDLETRLDLVKVKIARLTDIAELRALTPGAARCARREC